MIAEEDPVFGILLKKYPPPESDDFSILGNEFSNFKNFPEFKKEELQFAFQKHLAGATYHDLLLELGYEYPYSKEILKSIITYENWQINQIPTLARIVLMNFVTYVTNIDNNDIMLVIEALFFVIESAYFQLAIPALDYIFDYCINLDIKEKSIAIKYIEKLFNQYPYFAKPIITILSIYSKYLCPQPNDTQEMAEISADFLKFIINFTKRNPNFLNLQAASDIIKSILPSIVRLDTISLQVLRALSNILDENNMITAILSFPMQIREQVEKEKPFLVSRTPDNQEIDTVKFLSQLKEAKLPPFKESSTASYTHPPRETFKMGIDIKKGVKVTEQATTAQLVPSHLYSKLQEIGFSLKNHPNVAKILLADYGQCVRTCQNSNHFFDHVAVFLTLYKSCNLYELTQILWDTLFHTYLFDSRINIFDNDSIDLIDQLRAHTFSALSINGFMFLPTMFKSFLQKPELVAEMLRRILDEFDQISEKVFMSSSFANSLCNIIMYFQSLHFECQEQHLYLIETTRSVILMFVSQVLSNNAIASYLFSVKYFLNSFFALVFEPALCDFILGIIRAYLTTKGSANTDVVINELINISKLIYIRFPDTADIKLGTALLETLNDVMSHSQKLIEPIMVLADSICSVLPVLENDDVSDGFLVQALHFFAVVSSVLRIKSPHMQAIIKGIQKVEEDKLSQQVLTYLKQICAGTQISSVSPFFVIQQPKALKAMLNITKTTSEFSSIVTFLYSLVQFTYQNCIIMNRSGIDMLLLEIIDEQKNHEIDQQVLDCVFSIITLISLVVSSTLVMHRFLSLMFPIEGKYLSNYHQYFVKKLIGITSLALRAPQAYIGVRSSVKIAVKGVTKEDFGNEFMVCFWVYVDHAISQAHSKIIEVFDRKIRGFNIFISSGSLLFTCLAKTTESTARIDLTLPRGQWSFVSVEISNLIKGKTNVQTRVNDEVGRRLEFRWKGLKNGPLNIQIGDQATTKVKEYPSVLLGNFQILKILEQDDMKTLIENGPRGQVYPDAKLSLTFSDREGTVYVSYGSQNKNVTFDFLGGPVPCMTSFIDVLCNLCKVRALIPLFSLFDMRTPTGEKFPEIPELIVDLFTSTLSISQNIQESFSNAYGIPIISHLIQESKTFPRTYQMYTRFCNMLSGVTHRELQKSILESILCNFSFVMQFDPLTQMRIIKYWKRNLLPGYPSIFYEILPVQSLIAALHAHFEKGPSMIETIRENIRQLIVDVAAVSINEADVLSLISEAISTNSIKRVKETLRVIAEIFDVEPGTNIDKLKYQITHIVLLNNVIANGDEEILKLLVSIICNVQRLKLVPAISQRIHFELVMQNITTKCCTHDAAVSLAYFANTYGSDIIPLCLYVAMNVDDSAMFDVFQTLKPQPLTTHSRMWVIASVTRSSSDIRSKALNFLIDCDDDWSDTIATMNVVNTALGEDANNMISDFLMLLGKRLLDDGNDAKIETFLALSKNAIFFHYNKKSGPLSKEFATSPFFIEPDESEEIDAQNNAFEIIRARSMMSRSFIFVNGSNEKIVDENDSDIDVFSNCISKSKSESSITTDLPKIDVKKRRSSVDESMPLSPHQTSAFLFRPPTESKLYFSMNDFYQKLENFAKRHHEYAFSIRRDKNGRWLDIEIANQFCTIYLKKPSPLHLPTVLMILLIMLHSHHINAEKILKALNPTAQQIKTSKIYFQALKLEIQKLGLKTEAKFMTMNFHERSKFDCFELFANSISPLDQQKVFRTADTIRKDNLKMVELQGEFINFENAENIGFCLKQASHFLLEEQKMQRRIQKLWQSLWSAMTMPLALWEGAAPKKVNLNYSRDFRLCNHYAAIRQRINRNILTFKRPAQQQTGFDCTYINPFSELHGTVSVSKNELVLSLDTGIKTMSADKIKYIIAVNFRKKPALEIVRRNGIIVIIVVEEVQELLASINSSMQGMDYVSQNVSAPDDFLVKAKITDQWLEGRMTNFEYLMLVNIAAGRVFYDTANYPIFPWVITDMKSSNIDTDDSKIYRDLRKSMGLFNDERVAELHSLHPDYLFDKSYSTADSIGSFLGGKIKISEMLKISEMNNFELTPEFFSYPEAFTDSQLPPWASSPADFVYKHRKALESVMVSATLHIWLNTVFGLKMPLFSPKFQQDPGYDFTMKNGTLPPVLFTQPNPGRAIEIPEPIISDTTVIETDSRMVSFVSAHFEDSKLVIRFVLRNGVLKQYFFNGTTFQSSGQDIAFDKNNVSEHISSSSFETTITETRLGICSASGNSPYVEVIGMNRTFRTPFGLIRSIYGSSRYLSAVCTDMTTRIWNIENDGVSYVASYRDYTICSCVSEEYGIVVSGTRDGTIQICSLEGSVIKVISLGDRKPLRVIVCPGSGSICVLSERTDDIARQKDLVVLSINGIYIGCVEVDSIRCWSAWEDWRGIDYIALATEKKKIVKLEVNNLEWHKDKIRCEILPVSMHYCRDAGVLVLVDDDGVVQLTPIC